MKCKHLLFLTFLISQAAPVWGMMDEEETFSTCYSTAKATSPTDGIENLPNTIQEPIKRTHESPDYQEDATKVDTGRIKTPIDHTKIIDIETERNDLHFANALNNADHFFLPIEIKVHILSFLNQWDLLRAGGISKSWREATEMAWKNKPLNLSNRSLSPSDCKTFVHSPFSSLIFKSLQLKTEVSGEDSQLPEGIYQLLSVQNRTNEWIEKWQRLDEDPNLIKMTDRTEQQVYEICRVTGDTKQEAYIDYRTEIRCERQVPYAKVRYETRTRQESYEASDLETTPVWGSVLMGFLSGGISTVTQAAIKRTYYRTVEYQHPFTYTEYTTENYQVQAPYTSYRTVPLPDVWRISKISLSDLPVSETTYRTVPLPDLWQVPQGYQALRGSAPNGNSGVGLNSAGQESPVARQQRDMNIMNIYNAYKAQSNNPNTIPFIRNL